MRIALDQSGNHVTGYGLLGRGIEAGLRALGHTIDDRAGVRLLVYPPWGFKGKYVGEELWVYTMFEGTTLPALFCEYLDNFDGIIVPNDFNLGLYGAEHPNVHKARHGLDPFWEPIERTVAGEFRVSFFGRMARKGEDLAPRIFAAAFPDADRLDPKPVYIPQRLGKLSAEDVRERFYAAHVCLAPSRGEGWNFMPFQALGTGCPTVLTHIPGHDQYDWVPGAYPFGSTVFSGPLKDPTEAWASEWWEPDVAGAAEQLRCVYANYSQALSEAREGAAIIHRDFTWERAAQEIVDAIGDYDRPERGDEYQPPHNRAFEFVVDRLPDCKPSIGGVTLDLTVGRNYLTADQARVLHTAGYGSLSGNWIKAWEEA